jgi:hypothetical protein
MLDATRSHFCVIAILPRYREKRRADGQDDKLS